jgi:hypothetical protein
MYLLLQDRNPCPGIRLYKCIKANDAHLSPALQTIQSKQFKEEKHFLALT